MTEAHQEKDRTLAIFITAITLLSFFFLSLQISANHFFRWVDPAPNPYILKTKIKKDCNGNYTLSEQCTTEEYRQILAELFKEYWKLRKLKLEREKNE